MKAFYYTIKEQYEKVNKGTKSSDLLLDGRSNS